LCIFYTARVKGTAFSSWFCQERHLRYSKT
jgi:hypothetical protein